MTIPPEMVRLWNQAHPRLGLSAERIAQLPAELDQLRAAAEAVRPLLDFDADPAGFRAAMLDTRQEGGQ